MNSNLEKDGLFDEDSIDLLELFRGILKHLNITDGQAHPIR